MARPLLLPEATRGLARYPSASPRDYPALWDIVGVDFSGLPGGGGVIAVAACNNYVLGCYGCINCCFNRSV